MLLFIAELVPGSSAVEPPVNRDAIAVHAAVPCFRLPAPQFERGDPATSQTLAREEPDFDLGLVEPTAVSGRVMDGEAIPDLGRHFRAEDVGQHLAPMDVEVVLTGSLRSMLVSINRRAGGKS